MSPGEVLGRLELSGVSTVVNGSAHAPRIGHYFVKIEVGLLLALPPCFVRLAAKTGKKKKKTQVNVMMMKRFTC